MAVPTAANEAVPIISPRVNPTPLLRFEFIIAPRVSLSFPFQFGTWPYLAARPNPLTSLAILIPGCFRTHRCRARRISAWRERTLQSLQLSELLCVRTQTKRSQDSDSCVSKGRGRELGGLMRPISCTGSNAANWERLF